MSWFSFSGRITRSTWWLGYVLVYFVVVAVASVVDVAVLGTRYARMESGFGVESDLGVATTIAIVVMLWPMLAGQVKRWHDRDKSGWWVLINFIPLIGGLWALVETGFLRGTAGPNRFGPDPLGGQGQQPQWQPGQGQHGYGGQPGYGAQSGGYQPPPNNPPPGYAQGGYGQPGGYQPPPNNPPPQQGGGGYGGYTPPPQPPPPAWGQQQPPPPSSPWGRPPGQG